MNNKLKDYDYLLGIKINMLTAISLPINLHREKWSVRHVECLCECGNKIWTRAGAFAKGRVKSCGCIKKIGRSGKDHHGYKWGTDKNKLYIVYRGIKTRTTVPSDTNYHKYGARGIKMCEEWFNDYGVFLKWAMENGYKEGLSIERNDNDGDYCPTNCRFITIQEQALNKRNTRYVEHNGEMKPIHVWCDLLNLDYKKAKAKVYKQHKKTKVWKLAISILFLFLSFYSKATTYYVASSGNNSNNGTSIGTPWQTISKVNGSTFAAGDFIEFNRGDVWTTTRLAPPSSGSAGNPITFGAYGSGSQPVFSFPTSSDGNAITIFQKSYIVIDNIFITDLTMSATDHTVIANVQYGVYVDQSNHITVQNCSMSLVGCGVSISFTSGTIGNNTITGNSIFNTRMIVNDGSGDYGCNGIVMGSANNMITHNSLTNMWGTSVEFTIDGAAIECFTGNCDDNNIGYNFADSCAAWIEQGSSTGGTQSNLNWYYNLIINCGQVNYVNGSGSFAVTPVNNTWYNNVIVQTETPISSGTPGFFKLFNGSGTYSAGAFIFKNNIFKVTTSAIQFVFGNSTGTTHENNIYQLSGGAAAGLTLDASELATSSTLWVSTTGNAAVWDYHLIAGSPAIDFGQNVGISPDYGGTTVPNPPDAGIYQFEAGCACGIMMDSDD